MKKLFIFPILILALFLSGCYLLDGESSSGTSTQETHEGQIKAPELDASINFKDAKKIIEDAGFTNVKCVGEVGTFWGIFSPEDSVDYVTYGGDKVSGDKKWFNSDVEVIIYYYTTNDSPNKPQEFENYTEDDYKLLCEELVKGYSLYYYNKYDSWSGKYYFYDFTRNVLSTISVSYGRKTGNMMSCDAKSYDIVGDMTNGWTLKDSSKTYYSYKYDATEQQIITHYESENSSNDTSLKCNVIEDGSLIIEKCRKKTLSYEYIYRNALCVNK